MKPDTRFVRQPKNFWAHVRTISQHVGYTTTGAGYIPVPPGLTVPNNYRKNGGPSNSTVRAISLSEICDSLRTLGLRTTHIVEPNGPTRFGQLLLEYFEHRAFVLNTLVRPNLMDADDAKQLFTNCKQQYGASGPFVMNKQKGRMKAEAFLTCMVRIIVEANSQNIPCNFDPLELTTVTRDSEPYRTLARRVDGAFPSPVNPIAIWEIKEYYYTTTFGSRIADGVYETLLDGMEIEEFREDLGVDVKHYLITDSHFTWWGCGKSYLCRIIDMLHMGYVDEVLFGREIIAELPRIVAELVDEYNRRNPAV